MYWLLWGEGVWVLYWGIGVSSRWASDRANRVAYGERYDFYSTYRMCMPIEHLRASSLAGASMKQKVIALSRRLGP